MLRILLWILLLASALPVAPLAADTSTSTKPRLVVLTDMGGDPDDRQSMIRLMLYANEFELEGLIASASGVPGELKQKVTRPELIREIVEAYGKVRPNLLCHNSDYPAAAHLLKLIKSGNSNRGRGAVGEGNDTEGSRWIIEVVDRADTRPVNVTIWGGQTDLAQALWRVRQDRGSSGLASFANKLRIYDIADQDRMVDWIWQEFPGLFYIIGQAPIGLDMRESVYRGLYLGGDESLVSREWMETNIRQGHGPLGALYPPRTWTAPNPHSAIKEGDTPSWFYFLPTGLGDPEHPEWGGLGGRFTNVQGRVFRDAHDTAADVTDARCTVWRWRQQFQHDFAGRLDWCVADSFEKANHSPVAVLNGDRTRDVVQLTAKPGDTVRLSAEGTTDPDGDALEVRWWIYPEPSTPELVEKVNLNSSVGEITGVVVPPQSTAGSLHVILEVRDKGAPVLWAFRRAVIEIKPN